jgi:FKBP-type peptidyl-prolyl cis-trans isomerase
MRIPKINTSLILIMAGLLPVCIAEQQAQTPAAKTPAAPAAKAPQTPAAKPARPATRTQAPLTLKTKKDKASYAIGMNFGVGLKKGGVDVDPAIVARGLRDSLLGSKTLLTEEQAKATLTELQGELRSRQQAMAQQAGESNKREGQAFLEANKAKGGVVALPSGLQYKILQEGSGPKPAAGDSVVCNYRGTLLDGTEFDSSYKRGEPATFPVGRVIKGWTEALQLMPVGSKWQLFIPPDLGYGPQGSGGQIGPNAVLIFEIELLSIQPKGDK